MADMLNLVWAAAADRSRRGPLWASTSYASPVVDPAVRLGLGHRQLDPGCAEPIDRLTSATSFGEGFWRLGVGAPPRRVRPPPIGKPSRIEPPSRAARAAGPPELDPAVIFAPDTSMTSNLLLISSIECEAANWGRGIG